MYTPNNPAVYLAAFAGTQAALGARDLPFVAPDHASVMADAFAQAIDLTWGTDGFTDLDLEAIQTNCIVHWQQRSPLRTDLAAIPEAYDAIARGIIALVKSGTAQVTSQGVAPSYGITVTNTVYFSPSSPSVVQLQKVVEDQLLTRVVVKVIDPFDGPGANCSVGLASAPDGVFAPGEVDLSVQATFDTQDVRVFEVPDILLLNLSLASSTVGKGVLLFTLTG